MATQVTRDKCRNAALLSLCITLSTQGSFAEEQCWRTTFFDDFARPTLNSDRWNIVEGDGCSQNLCGWGNNEAQWYSANSISIADGTLRLRAQQHDKRIESGKLTTEGKFSQRYGRFEARMKLPAGEGLWPAFWLMPENRQQTWPIEGEIDILERGGHSELDLRTILGAVHFGQPWPNNTHYSESLLVPEPWHNDFHTYRVEWRADGIEWSVDEKVFGQVAASDLAPHPWPFADKPFHIILNLAVGGTLGGPVKPASLPDQLEIDWVKVSTRCD